MFYFINFYQIRFFFLNVQKIKMEIIIYLSYPNLYLLNNHVFLFILYSIISIKDLHLIIILLNSLLLVRFNLLRNQL